MRSHEARPSSVPLKLELWVGHCCPPQSKLWRGQSIPVPPMIYATDCVCEMLFRYICSFSRQILLSCVCLTCATSLVGRPCRKTPSDLSATQRLDPAGQPFPHSVPLLWMPALSVTKSNRNYGFLSQIIGVLVIL